MADVTLSVTIPDAYVTRVLTAISGLADKKLKLKNDGIIEFEFTYLGKQNGETNKAFAKIFLKILVKTAVKLNEFSADVIRYKNDTSAIALPSQNVPDGIIA